MNPMLLPIAGGVAIVLLLGLLLQLRRRARQMTPADEAPQDEVLHDEYDEFDEFDEHGEYVGAPDHAEDVEHSIDPEPQDAEAWEGDHRSDDGADDDTVVVPAYGTEVEDAEAFHTPELLQTPESSDDWSTEVAPGPEPVNVRYLRAQVRTLQEALERVQDVPETTDGRSGEATFRRQVTAALRGLGERTREDESPERTLARVVAAIDRLEAPDEVSRPALPTVKFDLSGAQMSLAGAQYVASPAALSAAPVQSPVQSPVQAPVQAPAPEPAPAMAPATAPAHEPFAPESFAPEPGPASVTTPLASALAAGYDDRAEEPAPGGFAGPDPFAQDEEFLPPPPEPDVVRPVPPPATHREERPRRFGRRHGA